jgi:hypothetical protein
VLNKIPYGLFLCIGEPSVSQGSDDLYPKGEVVHHDVLSPLAFSRMPQDIVRRSDLISGSVRIDHEMARQNIRELIEDTFDGSRSSCCMMNDYKFFRSWLGEKIQIRQGLIQTLVPI